MPATQSSNKNQRQGQAERTKERLFRTAVALLAESDFEQITIREIVAEAGVAIGTFYKYYSTKMEVFYETYRIADYYFQKTVAPMLVQPDTRGRILAFFDHYAYYNTELTDMKMTKLLYNTDNPYFNRNAPQGMFGVLSGVIRDGLDRGELAGPDSAEEIAAYLMIAVRGLVYNWCTTDGAYDLNTAMKSFVERLLKAYELR